MISPEFVRYSWNTPNGQKAVIALEEMSADYIVKPVDITSGEQHASTFRAVVSCVATMG